MKKQGAISIILTSAIALASASALGGCGKPYISDSFSALKWPDSKLAELLPEPESTDGMVEYDRQDLLRVFVGKTTAGQYESYVSSCKERGFTENYDSGVDYKNRPYYRAENGDGYYLELEYHVSDDSRDYKPMKQTLVIELREPEEETEAKTEAETEKPAEKATEKPAEKETEKPKESSESKDSKSGGEVSAGVKEALDEYEAFVDEYCEFMKKYSESGNALDMLSDYTDMLKRLSDYEDKIDSLDYDDMNAAEKAYYDEVMLRVSKKLLEAAYTV